MLELPPHIEFARSRDWDATPMGPIETWSGDLRIMVRLSDLIFAILPHTHYALLSHCAWLVLCGSPMLTCSSLTW